MSGDVSHIKRGRRDARRGVPRFADPSEGLAGQQWTYGWNAEHGRCLGCRYCLTGCEPLPTLRAHLRRCLARRGALPGRLPSEIREREIT